MFAAILLRVPPARQIFLITSEPAKLSIAFDIYIYFYLYLVSMKFCPLLIFYFAQNEIQSNIHTKSELK